MKLDRSIIWLCLSLGSVAHASPVSLAFDSLPSAQGWEYFGTWGEQGQYLQPETEVFQTQNDTLTQTSSVNEGARYFYRWTFDQAYSHGFEIDIRARVVDFDPQSDRTGFQFQLSSQPLGSVLSLFLYDAYLDWFYVSQSGTVNSVVYDNSQFHDYRFRVTDAGWLQFTVDGQLIATQSIAPGAFVPYQIYFGNLTGDNSANVEIARLSVKPVPVPAGLGLLMIGLGCMISFSKKPGGS
ncbi:MULTISPECIES: hypothetical protein [Methylomonas]|uniref:hypothetical protein n=1 Tax=Methylomonas TaxID=416 RepID=UPI0012323452|nr:hypothetical protein [Methylomonas rhizoryzae]